MLRDKLHVFCCLFFRTFNEKHHSYNYISYLQNRKQTLGSWEISYPINESRGKETKISRAASRIGTVKTELLLTHAPEFNQTSLATNQVVNRFERGW